ncbi:MAG: DUF3857 domain-containing protein [Pseudomonadota bacterium]|nr:DUF3857 domain-containing protein [Pseudomonadota bacterium]
MRDESSSRPDRQGVRWIAMYAGMLLSALALATGWAWADDMVELAQKPAVTAPPGWVTKVDAERADPNNSQLDYLLIDRQLRVENRGSSLYTRFAVHLGNQSAVDDESHLQITYRPATERITLHSLALRRGDRIIDQLRRARISTLRRELDLEQGIIDGDLTTSIVLEDVRVGDVLEYSYTRVTGEDGLGTAFSDFFTTQWSTPTRYSYLRVLHPTERSIAISNTNASEQPTVRVDGAWRELVWQWHGLVGIPAEEDRPPGFVLYPYIQLSESQSWQEVARWAKRLYPSVPLSPELRSLAAQLHEPGASKQELIIRALRFAQDEIRYTGIEIGPGGYQPQPPDVVLKRRFGDCKEKSYLLVTLLQAFGVDARPALVNSYRKQAARDLLPSAAAFNHMIVRVEHAGKVYWLDPTASLQGGTLDSIQQAHFGAALVVDDAGKFETMPAAVLETPNEIIVERFDLKAGVFEQASMTVESIYFGAEADGMRSYFAGTSRQEIARQYLNYYKDEFPNISVGDALVMNDDRQANKLVVTEHYALDPAFTKGDTDDRHYFEINAHVVRSAARAPKTIVRTSPLQLDHPTHVRYRAEIRLPERWTIEELNKTIAAPGFTYTSSVRYKRDTVVAEYAFRTLAEQIPAADAAEHARKLEAVREDAYYYLSHTGGGQTEPAPFKISLTMLFAIIGGMLGGGLLIRWLHRYENFQFPGPAPANSPAGIRGWMVLPAFGTIATPLLLAYTIYLWGGYFDAGVWENLGNGQDAVLAHWGKIGMFCTILLIYALFLVSTFVIYLLFGRRRSYPAGCIAVLWLSALWGALTQVSVAALGAEDKYIDAGVIRDFLTAALWSAYMMNSDRVRATFVRTRATVSPSPRLEQSLTAPAQ